MKRFLLVVALILAVLAWAVVRWKGRPRPPAPPPAAADTSSAGFRAVRLYFASEGGDSLMAESREMVEPPMLRDRVAALVRELDRGPTRGGVAVLPAGTSVRFAYLASGSAGLRYPSALGRCFRDIHAATQHLVVDESTLTLAGQALLGA